MPNLPLPVQTHDVDAKPVVEAADILKRDRVVADAVEEIALHAIAPETSCEREAFPEKVVWETSWA